jgi:ATP-dependent DNA helicase PIF1
MGTKTDPNEFFDLSKSKPKVVSVSPASKVKNIPDDLMSTTTNNSIIISNNDRNNNTTTDDNNDNDTQTKQDSSTAQIIKTQNKKINKTQLKEDLKQYRMQQANYNKKPAYTIFTNAALDGIYKSMPTTRDELLDVKGIGPMKADLYGDDILAIVSNYKRLGISSSSTSTVGPGAVVTARARIDPTTLTLEQRLAAEIPLGKEQRNVFITGSAGTGKSYLLKYIVEELRERKKGTPNSVAICAPTGVAAIIVGGSTLHSFFGIGLGQGSIPSLLKKVNKNSGAKKRIDETDILIIDECSMLSADLLEKLDAISREIRKDGKFCEVPFGGMQIIAFGDFFQLPPVVKRDSGGFNDRRHRPFCFDSETWSELGLSENIIELKEVQRQDNEKFVSLLNKVRVGDVRETDINNLNSKCLISDSNPLPTDGILPTRLYVLNKDVDQENISRLADLEGKEIKCTAVDTWRGSVSTGIPAAIKKKMKESLDMEMPNEVRLKLGAQVMLTRNKDLDRNLVNGSRGVVEGFEDDGGEFLIPIVRFDSGTVTKISPVESLRYGPDGGEGCLVRMQIPLKLAWAITIHKSQGSTLTRALLDITSAFEYGQCYVALSRVKSLEGLWLEKPARLSNVMVSPQVLEFFNGSEII